MNASLAIVADSLNYIPEPNWPTGDSETNLIWTPV